MVRVAIAGVLFAAACSSGAVGGSPRGVVTGVVYSSPTCPVVREGQQCPPSRLSGAFVVARTHGRQVAATRTDSAGHFSLVAPLGRCRIIASNIGGYASKAARTVIVGTTPTTVSLTVDSGIR